MYGLNTEYKIVKVTHIWLLLQMFHWFECEVQLKQCMPTSSRSRLSVAPEISYPLLRVHGRNIPHSKNWTSY